MPSTEPFLGEISAYLARPPEEDDSGKLERALTDGYARVLSLETDRVRLDKQIARLTVDVERQDAPGLKELQRLARQRELRARDLARLRAALDELRGRYALAARGGR